MKTARLFAPLCAAALLLAGCSSGTSGPQASTSPAGITTATTGTIKVWAYGSLDDATHLKSLAEAFKQKYPGVQIDLQGQPGDNYYALLQASLSAGQGPDVFAMFPGGYQKQFESYSLDLTGRIPQADLESVQAQYFSANGTINSPIYGVPVTAGMYQMFYNKKLLSSVGVTSVPTDWDELSSACQKVVAAGKTCFGYGSESGAGSFAAIYDWSYLASVLPLTQWNGLTTGTQAYNSPELLDQVTKWSDLHAKGYTNPDVMTWRDVRKEFLAGNVAMIMSGSWDASWASKGLGADAAAAPAPFSPTPIKTLIQMPDNGFSISKDSKSPDIAAAFLQFAISEEGQNLVSQAGNVPSRPGIAVQQPINDALLKEAEAKGWEKKPMFDNFIAPSVTDALNKGLNQALAGQITPADALNGLDAATKALPAKSKVDYHLGGAQ